MAGKPAAEVGLPEVDEVVARLAVEMASVRTAVVEMAAVERASVGEGMATAETRAVRWVARTRRPRS